MNLSRTTSRRTRIRARQLVPRALPQEPVAEVAAGAMLKRSRFADLYGQPDEDFWQNPAAPQQATLWQKLPLGDVQFDVLLGSSRQR
jgi:hypothetical protein